MMQKALTAFTTNLGKILPEGRVRKFLRVSYYRSPLNLVARQLEALGEIVARTELVEDDSLLVELNSGMRFYAPRDKEAYPPLQYTLRHGRQSRLSRVKGLEYFWGLVAILREIFLDNIYEQHYKLKEGDVALDIGAHSGIFTVKAAKAVGDKGLVIAIEPDGNNLKFLERNIRGNKLRNVITVQKGVWSREDKLKLYLGCNSGSHSMMSSFYLEQWQSREFIEVEVDTLDNMLRELGVKRVDFIKMDIEGAEIEALKGMKETLHNDVNLAIAAYHKQEGKPTYKTVVPWLEGEGFKVREYNGIVYGARSFSSSS